jgi:ascorbate-specific PTS system EIIC-type component UlaA
MHNVIQQKGFIDAAMVLAFSPVILGFLIGALPVLIPVLIVRSLSRVLSGP